MVRITKSYIVMPKPDKAIERKFDSYPTRGITLSDEVWNELKTAKLLYGKNWNKFIKQLLNDNALNQNNPHRSVRSRSRENLTE